MVADDFRLSNGLSLTNKAGIVVASGVTNLNAGSVVVLNAYVSADAVILLTYGSKDGTIAAIGEDLGSRVAGTSFKVKSTNVRDTNLVIWAILPGT